MSYLSNDLRAQLAALTDWWEGAGVDVDTRQLDRMLSKIPDRSVEQSHVDPTNVNVTKPAHRKPAVSGEQLARALSSQCNTLEELKSAIESFNGCDLKITARNMVFADGPPEAKIMVIGEGPGREEDETGKPFIGPAGQLLDKMIASIGLSRQTNTYITNVNFWRPPGNRNPTDEELAICRPFVDRHIQLVSPKIIIATGAVPSQALLGTTEAIGKLRGTKHFLKVPGQTNVIPMFSIFHPSYLLNRPASKRQAWHDLLLIQKEIETLQISLKP